MQEQEFSTLGCHLDKITKITRVWSSTGKEVLQYLDLPKNLHNHKYQVLPKKFI